MKTGSTPLHDRIFEALAARGCGPLLVQVGLHAETIAELERERAANAPAWGLLPAATEVFGFPLVRDPLAPLGVVLIRERPEPEGKAPHE